MTLRDAHNIKDFKQSRITERRREACKSGVPYCMVNLHKIQHGQAYDESK